MSTPTGSLPPESTVHSRYRIVRQIGRGGMGAVYEAIDTRLNNRVALKQTLVQGAQFDAAFEREAQVLAALRHPALPVVSDYFAEGDGQFLVMQYIPGDDLASLLRERGGPFTLGEVLPWAKQLVDALDYLHTQSPPIIHRDIKPQNLKLTPRGEIVLLDFGLAKQARVSEAAPSLYGYTPQFAPLEQIRAGGTDARSDLYSLAATLYALLTNSAPANALDRAGAVLQGEPDPLQPAHLVNPAVPQAFSALLQRAMAINAADRPATAAALRDELQGAVRRADQSGSAGAPTVAQLRTNNPQPILGGLPPAPSSPPPGPPPPPPRRGWVLFGMIGLVIVALCAVIGGAVVMLTSRISASIPDLPEISIPTLPAVPDLPDIEATAGALQGTAMAELPNIEATAAALQGTVMADLPDVGATVESVQETAAALQTAAAGGFATILTPEVDPDLATVELAFGAEGTGPGFLNDPRGAAVGPDGAIYVADYGSGRVQRFSPAGQFERSWVLEDDRPIMALAADRAGFVYVSQNSQISKFDGATGEIVATFTDSRGDGFEELIVLADGSLLGIPWAESDIVRLSADGEELGRIEDPFAAADLDESPGALAADGLGNLFILDDNGENVFRFNPEGRFQDRFSVPDSWSFADLAVDGQGRIYVASFTGGVQIFAADGSPLGRIAVPGVPFDVSFDDQNRLYVVTNSPQVLRLAVAAR